MTEQTGEPHGLRSRELLESACARPRNLWAYDRQENVAILATSLLFGIAGNHPFTQGNKRTGFTAMIGFLGANGFHFNLVDDVAIAENVINVLERRDTEEAFASRLQRVIEPVRHERWR